MSAPMKDETSTSRTRPLTTPPRDSTGFSSRCIGASVGGQGGLNGSERQAGKRVAPARPGFSTSHGRYGTVRTGLRYRTEIASPRRERTMLYWSLLFLIVA